MPKLWSTKGQALSDRHLGMPPLWDKVCGRGVRACDSNDKTDWGKYAGEGEAR
jgi:hypothetical protein